MGCGLLTPITPVFPCFLPSLISVLGHFCIQICNSFSVKLAYWLVSTVIFISGCYRKAKPKENTIYLQVQISEGAGTWELLYLELTRRDEEEFIIQTKFQKSVLFCIFSYTPLSQINLNPKKIILVCFVLICFISQVPQISIFFLLTSSSESWYFWWY